MEEIRKLIEFEPKYEVSNLGNVRNAKTKRIRKLEIHENGYLRVKLSKNYRVHRLVALTFIPNPENKEQVDHINGDKRDNRLENLRWVTGKENMANINTIEKIKRGSKLVKDTAEDLYLEVCRYKQYLEQTDTYIHYLKELLNNNNIEFNTFEEYTK